MEKMFVHDFGYLIPEIYATFSVLVLLIYGVVFTTSLNFNYPILSRNIVWMTIFILILEICMILNHSYPDKIVCNDILIIDHFSLFVKIIILLGGTGALLMSVDYLKLDKINSYEYGILILLSTIGMTLLVSSYDIIAMYLAIEFQSLALYVLAAFKRDSLFSTESGLKYFVLGAFSSGILLFGSSIIYGLTGITNFEDLAKLFTGHGYLDSIESTGVMIGILLMSVGLLFKIYAVPFHLWVPDVYEGSPTIVTAFFAITPSISVIAVFLRLLISTFYDFIDGWQQILIFCSISSMILASFAALAQNKIKRLLAYSAIGHAGYILIGFSAATPEGIRAMLFYSIVYILMTIGIFSFVIASRDQFKNLQIKYLSDIRILLKTNPLLAITVALILFSFAGIPPLAGFFSKLYIFFAAIKVSMYFVVIIGIITSVIGSVYYLRLIQIMYFEKTNLFITYQQIDKVKSLLLAIVSFFLLFFFLYPSPLMIFSHKAAILLCL